MGEIYRPDAEPVELGPGLTLAGLGACDCCLCQGEAVHRGWDWEHRRCRSCGFEALSPDRHVA